MSIVIETERLFLRKFRQDDAGLIYQLNSDPEVTRYTCDPVFDQGQAARILNQVILPQYDLYHCGRWAVHLRSNYEFIGWCGLKYIPERDEIDLGYRFLKEFWRRGYATESALACLNYGFDQLNFNRIIARALPENHASIRVLEKCGMQYRGQEFVDGHLHKTYQATNPSIPAAGPS